MTTATGAAPPGALPEKAEPYRVSFTITGPGATGPELLRQVDTRITQWLRERSQAPEFDSDAPEGTWSADDYEISIDRDSFDDSGYASFKWECQDRRAPDFWLRMDLDLATDGGPVAVSVESYFLEQDDAEPPDLLGGPPPIVHELLDSFDCYLDGERLSAGMVSVTPDSAGDFAVGRILSPERRLPIVAVSQDGRGETAVDPERLQRVLAGVAVVAAYGGAAAQALRERLGWQLACYDGAVRVYWPGCAAGDHKGGHKVWLRQEAARLDFRLILQLQGECLRRFSPTFNGQMFEAVKWRVDREKLRLRFAELEERERRLQEPPETDYIQRINELEAVNTELKRQLGLRTQEIKRLKEEQTGGQQSSSSAREPERVNELEEEAANLISRLDEKESEIRELKTLHNVALRRRDREVEQLRQTFTNNEWVGSGLRLLKSGLSPFVQQKFIAHYQNMALLELQQIFQDDSHWQDVLSRTGTAEQAFREMDATALLRVTLNRWREAFINTLDTIGPAQETLVRNLRNYRNAWAHQHSFSPYEAYRALDSMHGLLSAINSPQAAAVEKIKMEHLKAHPDAQSDNRRQAA